MKKPRKTLLTRFNYSLPKKLISQSPTKPRDHARLLILDKKSGAIEHKKFFNITDYLEPGDVLVLNNSKVIPARLIGQKETGGKVEIFLLQKEAPQTWQALIKGNLKEGQKVLFNKEIKAKVINKQDEKTWLVKFNCSDKKLFKVGNTPLPPYIKEESKSSDYQTVYAKSAGSVAAPTAGLHFTHGLLNKLKKKGIKIEYITLHVGLGTFWPVKSKYLEDHKMHAELAKIDQKTAKVLNKAKKTGNRIVAVGTTSVRTLEALSSSEGLIKPISKWVNIFIYPGYKFKFVDSIITNFHLPQTTLLVLVCAFATEKHTRKTYQEAIKKKYQFYSFGDAMLIK